MGHREKSNILKEFRQSIQLRTGHILFKSLLMFFIAYCAIKLAVVRLRLNSLDEQFIATHLLQINEILNHQIILSSTIEYIETELSKLPYPNSSNSTTCNPTFVDCQSSTPQFAEWLSNWPDAQQILTPLWQFNPQGCVTVFRTVSNFAVLREKPQDSLPCILMLPQFVKKCSYLVDYDVLIFGQNNQTAYCSKRDNYYCVLTKAIPFNSISTQTFRVANQKLQENKKAIDINLITQSFANDYKLKVEGLQLLSLQNIEILSLSGCISDQVTELVHFSASIYQCFIQSSFALLKHRMPILIASWQHPKSIKPGFVHSAASEITLLLAGMSREYFQQCDKYILQCTEQIQKTGKALSLLIVLWLVRLEVADRVITHIIENNLQVLRKLNKTINNRENSQNRYKEQKQILAEKSCEILQGIQLNQQRWLWVRRIQDPANSTRKKKILLKGLILFGDTQGFEAVLTFIYKELIAIEQEEINFLKCVRSLQDRVITDPLEVSLQLSASEPAFLRKRRATKNSMMLARQECEQWRIGKNKIGLLDLGLGENEQENFIHNDPRLQNQQQKIKQNIMEQKEEPFSPQAPQFECDVLQDECESKYSDDANLNQEKRHQNYSCAEKVTRLQNCYENISSYYQRLIDLDRENSDTSRRLELTVCLMRYQYKHYKKLIEDGKKVDVDRFYQELAVLAEFEDNDLLSQEYLMHLELLKIKTMLLLGEKISYKDLQEVCQCKFARLKIEARHLFAKEMFKLTPHMNFEAVECVVSNLCEYATTITYKRKALALIAQVLACQSSFQEEVKQLSAICRFFNLKMRKHYILADFTDIYHSARPVLKLIHALMGPNDLIHIYNLAEGEGLEDNSPFPSDVKPRQFQGFQQLLERSLSFDDQRNKERFSVRTLNMRLLAERNFNVILQKIQMEEGQFGKVLVVVLGGDQAGNNSSMTDDGENITHVRQLQQQMHSEITQCLQKSYFHVMMVGTNLSNYQTKQGKIKRYLKQCHELLELDLTKRTLDENFHDLDKWAHRWHNYPSTG